MQERGQGQEKGMQQGAKASLRTSAKAVKAGAKLAKGIATGTASPHILLAVFAGLLFLSVLVSLPAASSTSQMSEQTYYMSVTNGEKVNRPSEEKRKQALYDQEEAKKTTTDLLEILTEVKEQDLEENVKKKYLKDDCRENGWDYELTLSKAVMDQQVVSLGTASQNSNQVQNEYELGKLSKKTKKTYTYEEISSENAGAGAEIFSSKKTNAEGGFWRFDTGLGEKDYLVCMGPYFGGVGSRFRVTFEDGSAITVLKAKSFSQSKSAQSYGMAKQGGGILEFLTDGSLRKKDTKSEIARITKKSAIKKVELLESEFSSQSTLSMSTTDSRVLAAYSVYLDNMELEAKSYGLIKKIVNQRGDAVQTKWIWSDNSVDLRKSLRDILQKFLKRTNPDTGKKNSFYKLDYKRDAGGNIIVESVVVGEEIRYYATPIIIELDINSIAEELYNLNPDDPYINSGKPYQDQEGSELRTSSQQISIRDAVNTIAEATDAILFDVTGDMQSNIIIADLQGQFLWPAPGYTTITSPYGRRTRPAAGASTMHLGIDIGCPQGSPVVAVSDGTVSFAGYYSAGGNWISLRHEKGIVTEYGHLHKILVSSGQPVKKGQVIAYSGNTGVSTGPHLHFQVVVKGNAVNPIPYVKGS